MSHMTPAFTRRAADAAFLASITDHPGESQGAAGMLQRETRYNARPATTRGPLQREARYNARPATTRDLTPEFVTPEFASAFVTRGF